MNVPLEELHSTMELLLDHGKAHLRAHVDHKIPLTIVVGRMDIREVGDETLTLYPVDGPVSKDTAESLIHAVARDGAADALIMISEAWLAHIGRPGDSREEADKLTNAVYAEYGSLEHHPYRREALVLTAHTRTHDIVRHVIMERNAEGLVIGFDEQLNETSAREESDAAGSMTAWSRFRPQRWGKRLTLAEVVVMNDKLREEEARMRRQQENA